jgi:hypothetical protein
MKQAVSKRLGLRGMVLAGAVVLSSLAMAAGPSVSVPSTPDLSGMVNIHGTQAAAGTNVTVRFVHDKLTPIDMVTQVAANGSFEVKFAPPVKGGYGVLVFDSNGQQIGGGRFGFY